LDKIKEQILKCKKCDLYKTVTNKVIGKGTKTPRILIIGEGPGADEDRLGIPFVGRSGKLLDKWIAFLDIQSEVAVINTIKCRTPQNRDPSREELDACREWLDKQIEILNPKYIITIGKVAMHEITGIDDGILKWQGQSVWADGRRVFIMTHPAYHLRRGDKEWQKPLLTIKRELEED